MIQLDYSDTRPLYEQIKVNIKTLIIRGIFIANQQLPSIRDLAADLTLNPNTIQKAYRDLEAEGYIYSVRGKGNFVAQLSKKQLDEQQAQSKAKLKQVLDEVNQLGISLEDVLIWINEFYKTDGGGSK